ncbi:MAG TPA: hypothetical protein VM261_18175 [Kofleriaceae bacterium]|nr:hypothetical protein [Kofleriaceae bacterium]
MSSVPTAIPDVGETSQRLRQNPTFDPLKAGFGTEEYFVWSRFDGTTTIKDLILMTGLPTERAIEIVRALYTRGAISPAVTTGRAPTTPSVAPPPPTSGPRATTPPPSIARTRTAVPGTAPSIPRVPTPQSSPPPVGRTPTGETSRNARLTTTPGVGASTPIPPLDAPTDQERTALDEPGVLPLEDRRRVLSALRLVAAGDPWALLGVARGADKKALKRAFFERSKLFHPDRFYGKSLGAYLGRLHIVFEALSRAHTELTDEGAARRASGNGPATAPQTPAEYAAELFDRACIAEVSGDHTQALKLFAAAVKLDGQARYLRRAAVCALAARELRAAEDYAKKAAALEGSDPSTARILGKVLRELGKLESAEEVLVMALAMKSENDQLMKELASDLKAVRADLTRSIG